MSEIVSYVYIAVYGKCSNSWNICNICTVLKLRTSEICIETVKIELFQSRRLYKMTKSVDPDQTAPQGAV